MLELVKKTQVTQVTSLLQCNYGSAILSLFPYLLIRSESSGPAHTLGEAVRPNYDYWGLVTIGGHVRSGVLLW